MSATGWYGGRSGRFTGRGGAWYPGEARGVGCLTGGGPEATAHGELHTEDEEASAFGHSVMQADGFYCGRRRGVTAELRCSRTTTIAVAVVVGNVCSSGRGKQRGQQSGAVAWRLSRKGRGRGFGVAATRDKVAAHTWRRRLHELHVERRWRAVDSAGARWRAVTETPQCRRARICLRWPRHAATGCRGPLASGTCHKFSFFQNFKIITNFVIKISDLPDVQNSPNFAGR
jgi:hypothetical protein